MENLTNVGNALPTNSYLMVLQKQIALVLMLVVATALIVNLGLLTYLGPKGQELSNLRNAQEEQKLQNDLMRAELENIKVSSVIETKAQEDLQMRKSDVILINPQLVQLSASNE